MSTRLCQTTNANTNVLNKSHAQNSETYVMPGKLTKLIVMTMNRTFGQQDY
jgi:hypothetical protein